MANHNKISIVIMLLKFLLIIAISALFMAPIAKAQTPYFKWAKQGGGSLGDYGKAIASDGSGNAYVTGYFEDMATFGPAQLKSAGDRDVFVVKYNSSGNVVWAKSGGGTNRDHGSGMAIDGSGNAFVTGDFKGTVTFGSYQLTSAGGGDIFVVKYNSSGDVVWAKRCGGTDWEFGLDIAADGLGNTFVTGNFSGTAMFGSYSLTSAGGIDMFVVKFNSSGDVVWAKNGGGGNHDYGFGIAVDGVGNSYVTGQFRETAIFGSYQLTSSGGTDIFVVKYNSTGDVVWAKNAGGTSPYIVDSGNDITVDESGNVFVTGCFRSEATFGAFQLTSAGGTDVFVVKYNSTGSVIWARNGGGIHGAYGESIATDDLGNIFVTGSFDSAATFDLIPLTSAGHSDVFIVKYNSSGNIVWAQSNGGVSADRGLAIALDRSGNVLVTGEFNEAAMFGAIKLTSAGNSDAFVAQIIETFIPSAPTLSSPLNRAMEVLTDPTLTWNTSSGAITYGLRIAVDSLFKNIIFNEGGSSTTSRVVSNLANNTTYYWQVNASNDGGTCNWSKYWRFTTKSTIDLSYTVLFPELSNPSDYSSTDYKIVGLPGVSDLSVKTVLAGSQNQDWQAYWDNGNPSENPKDFLVAFDGTSDFVFKAGRAFWIIKKGSLNINYSVKAASLDDSGLVTIELHYGWNLITNPFLSPVDWSTIEAFNNSIGPFWKYNEVEKFLESDVFEPYVGYYFFANADLDSLMIPYPHSRGFQKKSIYTNDFEDGSWRIYSSLSSGIFADKTLSFGVSEQAKAGLDKLDFRKPRGIASVPTACFMRTEWDPNYSTFATDIRPEFDEIESWDFEVRGVQKQNSRLDFTGTEQLPESMEIYLVDEARGKSINLREQPSYNFMGVGDIMKFQVVVGKSEAVEEKLYEISTPKRFALGNNYPNPFNPETKIPVEIPVAADVTLIIYNVLGQQVITIYQGYVEPGRYQFTWDGRDQAGNMLSSGVYILRLSTNSRISLTSKMILMQ